ncbi:23S rRNA pseudouridine1911/1915/1917 synthase [Saonia flava]|uniref:23S rRNA pseudouridine1911/1915/1917 synthase n=1 Tax=Saonia flava TaxID=523696 RepID=A0A846QZI0_9FLAO|nr:RluA family pseudouridine synthase [Saonia flava]NJB72607.1 23S rRNA pseudouridine1911/1915/1917 synthase [Saonia flava]
MVFVDGKIASTATMIKGTERITYSPAIEVERGKKLVLKLEVVYEDDYLAIVNKPAGILVSGNSFKTITNALVLNLDRSGQVDVTKPQPVHRLDYPTTGLLLVGKTTSSILALNQLFQNKEIAKTYKAVTIGPMSIKGSINQTIDVKEAESFYEVLKTVPSARFGCLNLVKLVPTTGRRHQLRKHLSGIGNPIFGDLEYGQDNLILKGKGLYLHAFSLEFIHPFTHKRMHVKKNPPTKFDKIFAE